MKNQKGDRLRAVSVKQLNRPMITIVGRFFLLCIGLEKAPLCMNCPKLCGQYKNTPVVENIKN